MLSHYTKAGKIKVVGGGVGGVHAFRRLVYKSREDREMRGNGHRRGTTDVSWGLTMGQVWRWTSSVAQLCLTLCDPKDYSPPGSSVHGISQARILEWVAMSFSRGSSQPRDQTFFSCICREILYYWATWEADHLKNSFTPHIPRGSVVPHPRFTDKEAKVPNT